MRMVIVTGMSGAGKSTALKVLEDIGYFCVDNLPIPLFLKFVEMSAQPDANLDKVAIGIDIRGGRSFARLAEELDVLKEKEIPHEILYLEQDMREFELYGTVRAIVSVCDCMNYITEEEDLLTVFKLVNNYLDPDGIFIFDMNTPYKYREILGNTTIAENREEGSFIWENEFDEETGINVYDLTLFLPREDGLYERDEEIHYQKAYEPEKIRELLEKAGLIPLAVYDAYTKDAPKPDSGRLTFVAREHGKGSTAEE